jgi:hypothetical protein
MNTPLTNHICEGRSDMKFWVTTFIATSIALAGTAFAQRAITGQGPDLVPVPNRILNGVASVRNAGNAAAPPSLLTVQCQKQGGGACAQSPGMAAYENPAYPNRLVINVPAIPGGGVHNHTLRFWRDLAWLPGSYNFVLEADAAKTVMETNEGNNFGGAVLTAP